jgi:putative acetyltransferase
MLEIREAAERDLDRVVSVVSQAFGSELEAQLVRDLLTDDSAKPHLSLLASLDERVVGHILFTAARLEGNSPVGLSLLAPLSVIPEAQGTGIGSRLTGHGLELLAKSGTELVFVLGYPGYYRRFGFKPAGLFGLDAPYPIAEKNADGWMVQELCPGAIDKTSGRILCAEALDKPEFWSE